MYKIHNDMFIFHNFEKKLKKKVAIIRMDSEKLINSFDMKKRNSFDMTWLFIKKINFSPISNNFWDYYISFWQNTKI